MMRSSDKSHALPRARRFAAVLALVPALGLCSCGAARPSQYYTLELPAAADRAGDALGVSLLVGRLAAPHLYRDTRVVYRQGATRIGTYEYHRWAEPPTDMLEAMLLRLLRSSGKYRSVQRLGSNARGDYIVRGRLHQFEEVSGPGLAARVTFEIELYEQASGTTVWSHLYSHDEPVAGKDVPAVIEALNRNVQRGLAEAASRLDDYFAARPR